MMPGAFGEAVHNVRPDQVLQCNYLHTGASASTEESGLDEQNDFIHILIVVGDLGALVGLELGEVCTATTAVDQRFAVAFCRHVSPLSNSRYYRMMQEVSRTLKAILNHDKL